MTKTSVDVNAGGLPPRPVPLCLLPLPLVGFRTAGLSDDTIAGTASAGAEAHRDAEAPPLAGFEGLEVGYCGLSLGTKSDGLGRRGASSRAAGEGEGGA